jgi:hypothetical protein
VTEEQFDELRAACDRVLLAPDSTLERMAIAWLHVLNEHPSNLGQYADLLAGSRPNPLLPLKSAAVQLRQWMRGRAAVIPAFEEPVDVLFISHLLHESQVGAGEDFYFGNAPEAVAARGASVRVMLRNHTPLDAKRAAQWPAAMVRRFVMPETLSLRGELGLRRALTAEAQRLRSGMDAGQTELEKTVRAEAARQARSMASLSTLRFFQQMLHCVATLRPKAVVVTFEGHAWERLAFAAARRARPDAACIGYHHTILFRRQHAALRPLGAPFDPDVVLTAGAVAAQRCRTAWASQPTAVATMGIPRRRKGPERGGPAARTGCLAIPDGILGEILFLFDFAIAAARHAPEIPFVLRLHTVLSQRELIASHPRFATLPPNVSFSSGSLDDDLEKSRCVLYRASSTSVYAAIAGLRPFYVRREGELSVDALDALQSWKKRVGTPAELVSMMKWDAEQDDAARAAEAAEAVAFCEKYFMPLDLNPLFEALPPAAGRVSSGIR